MPSADTNRGTDAKQKANARQVFESPGVVGRQVRRKPICGSAKDKIWIPGGFDALRVEFEE